MSLKWKNVEEGKVRSDVGTILKRPTGFFFYRRGERKADGGAFKSLTAAKKHAAALAA